jgi:hypothetical protein
MAGRRAARGPADWLAARVGRPECPKNRSYTQLSSDLPDRPALRAPHDDPRPQRQGLRGLAPQRPRAQRRALVIGQLNRNQLRARHRRIVRLSVANEAERVTCRVCVDPPAALAITDVERVCAELEDLLLRLVEILDSQVKVELLRASRIRPSWLLVVRYPLETQHEPRVEVERRPVHAERPPGIRLVDHAAQECLVEPREFQGIGAVQHHALQVGDHDCSSQGRLPFPPRALA